MSLRDLSVSDWVGMTDGIARAECEALARALPHGLALRDLKTHGYCGRLHRVARFVRGEGDDFVQFVLVPGGQVLLGFNGDDFKPSDWQIESFSCSAKEYDLDPSIRRFVDTQTSPRRTADIRPVLVEIEAKEVRMQLNLNPAGEASSLCAETTMPDVERRLSETGMRLLTCDEWEHACGAEAATLFRWGDDTPIDFYPTDTCAEDRALKRAWVLSRGPLAYETPPPKWDLHLRPNVFGLSIATNPYELELVSDGPRALGGDGGCNICGGAGFFLGWLPLATAFRDPYGEPIKPDQNIADNYHRVRRAISID